MASFIKNKKYYGEKITVREQCYFFAGTYKLKGVLYYLYMNFNLTNDKALAVHIVFKCSFKKLFNIITNELRAKKDFSAQNSDSFYFLYNGWHYRLSDHIHPHKGRKPMFEILIGATDPLVEVNGATINQSEISDVNDVYRFVIKELKKTNKRKII